MKRTTILLSMLVLLLSLMLVSCEAMFSSNVFAKITHPTPSEEDIKSKTPTQMQEYASSAANIQQLTEAPALKTAALDSLGFGSAVTASTVAAAVTADAQTSAIVAAEISIQTVPVAASFSGALLGTLAAGTSLSSASADSVTTLIESVLPKDVLDSLKNGDATPPESFTSLIAAFTEANVAFTALGKGVAASGYDAGLDLGSSADAVIAAKAEIAINAVISGVIDAVVPAGGVADTPANVSTALWGALNGGTSTFTIPSSTIDSLTSTTSTNPIVSLVQASSLGSLLKSTTTTKTGGN